MSLRGMILDGTAPHAWFQSWLGLYLLSQASMVMVLPARIMLYQLRSSCEESNDKPYSASPASYTASIRNWLPYTLHAIPRERINAATRSVFESGTRPKASAIMFVCREAWSVSMPSRYVPARLSHSSD